MFLTRVRKGLMTSPHRPPGSEESLPLWYREELDEALDAFPQDGALSENDNWLDDNGNPIAL